MKKADKLNILRDLVGINTVNGNEVRAAKYLKSLLKRYGIDGQLIDLGNHQANLVVEYGNGQKPVLAVSGHMDTVAVNEEMWNTNPFELVTKDDVMTGSGVTDMKGGLAAIVIALIEIKEADVKIDGTIRLLITAGEEVGMNGSHSLQSQGYMDDVDALLITEPTGYRIVRANKGEVDFLVTSTGKEAHSSRPNLGINAIQNLMDVLEEVKQVISTRAEQNASEVLGQTTYTVDVFNGGIQINAIPGSAKAAINTRIVPNYDNQQVIDDFNQIVDDFNQTHDGEINLEILMNIAPVVAKPDSKLIKELLAIATPYMKKMKYSSDEVKMGQEMMVKQGFNPFATDQITVMSAAGGTDASELLSQKLNGANYAVFGPGNPMKMHQNNESASLQMWLDFIEIYKKLFSQYFVN